MADPAPKTRLSVEDWVQAGFGVISDDGLTALTIERLCKRVGATKGSFYWHFTDLSAYRAALIDAWATLRDEDRGHFDDLVDLPPRKRLVADDDRPGHAAALDAGARDAGVGTFGADGGGRGA